MGPCRYTGRLCLDVERSRRVYVRMCNALVFGFAKASTPSLDSPASYLTTAPALRAAPRALPIYAVPDRVVYGYFDMLTRMIVESGRWDEVAKIPLLVPSRDFVAVKLQWEAKAAAVRRDQKTARAAAAKLVSLSQEPGQHPFAKLIISVQAKEAEAFAAAADADNAVAKLKEAAAIEHSIDDLSQPPYPVIPANEFCGYLLMEFNRPAEAATYFQKALLRTPNRPKVILGMARAAQALGDNETAGKRYEQFLTLWKTADS